MAKQASEPEMGWTMSEANRRKSWDEEAKIMRGHGGRVFSRSTTRVALVPYNYNKIVSSLLRYSSYLTT